MLADTLIVAKNQRALYLYLKDDFADDPDVTVLVDRREGERRRRVEPHSEERRRADRRVNPPLDDKLESIGFAIIRTNRRPSTQALACS
jgi:hypothetical protein